MKKHMKKRVLGMLSVCSLIFGVSVAPAVFAQEEPMPNQDTGNNAEGVSQVEVYTAPLSGEHAVPSVDTQAEGMAIFMYNSDEQSMNYRVQMTNLDNITEAHLHCAGENETGPAFLPLSANGVYGQGDMNVLQGTLTENDITQSAMEECNIQSMNDVRDAIENGLVYVNVQSEEHQDGEIRGQLSQQQAVDQQQMNMTQNNTTTQHMQVYQLDEAPEGMNAFLFLVSDEWMQMMDQRMQHMQQFQAQPQE